MKFYLRLLSLIILTHSITASWQQQFSEGYKSYIAPSLQSSYDYLKSLDAKYILLGGTLASLASLAYLKYLEENARPLTIEQGLALLAQAIEKKDLKYFSRRPQNITNASKRTIWGNPIMQEIAAEKDVTKRNEVKFYTYQQPDDISIYWPLGSKYESIAIKYENALEPYVNYAWDIKKKVYEWKFSKY